MKKILGIFIVLSALFTGTLVFAQGGGTGGSLTVSTPLQNPIKFNTFSAFVDAVITAAVTILMPFVILAFVWSGFLFVKAQGKPEEIETAKKAIIWSVIGAFILLGSWGFAQIIGETVRSIAPTSSGTPPT